MNLDDVPTITLREASEHTTSAERADNLRDLQEFGERALKTLETIDRSSLERDAKNAVETAIRHMRNVQGAVHPEGGRHDAREARQVIAGLLG